MLDPSRSILKSRTMVYHLSLPQTDWRNEDIILYLRYHLRGGPVCTTLIRTVLQSRQVARVVVNASLRRGRFLNSRCAEDVNMIRKFAMTSAR